MTAPSMTEQGRATRGRIVAAAAALIGEHGVSGTSLDDIRAATNSSKSQLYHYFGDKHGLVQAVIDYQSAVVVGAHAEALDAVQDWRDLERWVDSMVAAVEQQGAATQEIARNVTEAASGSGEIAKSIDAIANVARRTDSAAGVMVGSADQMVESLTQLRSRLDDFLSGVRAA